MGDELSLKNLEDAIRRYYRQTHAGHSNKKSDNSGDGKEIALSAFNGKCYKCHKHGCGTDNFPEKNNKNKK